MPRDLDVVFIFFYNAEKNSKGSILVWQLIRFIGMKYGMEETFKTKFDEEWSRSKKNWDLENIRMIFFL